MSYFAQEDYARFLANWENMNRNLMSLPVSAVKELLAYAVSQKRGSQMIERIYMRYNKLRRIEEIVQLRKGVLPWDIPSPSTLKLKQFDRGRTILQSLQESPSDTPVTPSGSAGGTRVRTTVQRPKSLDS